MSDEIVGVDEMGRAITARAAIGRLQDRLEAARKTIEDRDYRIDDLLERLRKAEARGPDLSLDEACRRLRARFGSCVISLERLGSTIVPAMVVSRGYHLEPIRRFDEDATAAVLEALRPEAK